MIPKHLEPLPYYDIITSYLSGYDACCLNYVNTELKEICNNIDVINRKTKEIDLLELVNQFKKNNFEPLSVIFITHPICSNRYPNPKEISKYDNRMLNSDMYCGGSIFVDPNNDKKYCEECMTLEYSKKWKDWDVLPRIAKKTKYFVKITNIEVQQEYFENRFPGEWGTTEYNLREEKNFGSSNSFWSDCTVHNIAYDIIFKGGRLRIPYLDSRTIRMGEEEDWFTDFYEKSTLVLDKQEYDVEDLTILI